MIFLEFKKFQ